jgi:hypothetical protein
MITYEELEKILDYDPETGILTWTVDSRNHTCKKGMAAGYIDDGLYRRIKINNKSYRTHRLAWLLFYKEHPRHYIDHIDRNKLNNAIINLRDVTPSENCRNTAIYKNNTSGYVGVSKQGSGYQAILYGRYIGYSSTAEAASLMYQEAKVSLQNTSSYNEIQKPKIVRGNKLSIEEIRDLFGYDPTTGVLLWKIKRRNRPTNIAGWIHPNGYTQIKVNNIVYPSHHLVWALHKGSLPDLTNNKVIDHINKQRSDNRIENLRLVSVRENNLNTTLSNRGMSGCNGVTYNKRDNKWVARISIAAGNRKHLGSFETIAEAIEARKAAEALYQ